jgi:hypothetical protein
MAAGATVGKRLEPESVPLVLRIGHLREAEVQHLHHAAGRHLDVGRLEVAVDHALVVRGLEGRRHLTGDGQRFAGAEGAV